MNQCAGKFVPSDLRRPSAAEPVKVKPATKATQEEPRADELSEEELEFARQLAADPGEGLARLYLNGELACVGLNWLPGMKEKWDRH